MIKTIGILGCGWLGFPLATALVEQQYQIHGSSTTKEKLNSLEASGIEPYHIELTENGIKGAVDSFLEQLDLLIINVPPRLRKAPKESYTEKMRLLHTAIKKTPLKRIMFISSTAVYGNIDAVLNEDSPARPNTVSGEQLLASENIFYQDRTLHTTIIRLGGLIGPNRHPVTFLAGKTDLKNGDHPINLIHLDDCIGIIKQLIKDNLKNGIINAVYPHHPSKKEYYTSEAQKRGLPPPNYSLNTNTLGNKIVESKYINVKTYSFMTSIVS